jgi:hypothetical protein
MYLEHECYKFIMQNYKFVTKAPNLYTIIFIFNVFNARCTIF